MEVFIIVVLIAKASFAVTNFKLNSKYEGGREKRKEIIKEEGRDNRKVNFYLKRINLLKCHHMIAFFIA